MVRTQIYLSESEREGLAALARRTGRTRSDLIRAAVQQFLTARRVLNCRAVLESKAGIWAERTDLPDFARLRDEWDRASDA